MNPMTSALAPGRTTFNDTHGPRRIDDPPAPSPFNDKLLERLCLLPSRTTLFLATICRSWSPLYLLGSLTSMSLSNTEEGILARASSSPKIQMLTPVLAIRHWKSASIYNVRHLDIFDERVPLIFEGPRVLDITRTRKSLHDLVPSSDQTRWIYTFSCRDGLPQKNGVFEEAKSTRESN